MRECRILILWLTLDSRLGMRTGKKINGRVRKGGQEVKGLGVSGHRHIGGVEVRNICHIPQSQNNESKRANHNNKT